MPSVDKIVALLVVVVTALEIDRVVWTINIIQITYVTVALPTSVIGCGYC